MVEIPLQQIPAQELQIILDDQNCTLRFYWRWWKLYADLLVDSEPVFSGFICQNRQWVNQSPSLIFAGGLIFVDELGDEAPRWDGLGDRWHLLYFTADEASDPESAVAAYLEESEAI